MKYDRADIGHWILTESGKKWNFADPRVEDVCLEDLVMGISKECRFGGQCHGFYSVAQHCVLVSDLCAPGYEMEGLLHDLHEGVYKDIPTPLKLLCPEYTELEAKGASVIRRALGVPEEVSAEVKRADWLAFAIERRDLLPDHPELPVEDVRWPPISPMPWHMAKALFLQRYYELKSKCK